MFQPEQAEGVVFKRIAQRVEDILNAARERERRGQHLALEIDAKFQLHDLGAVQFQLASAILEEVGGLKQEEIVSELLSLGLAAVLDGAARVASENSGSPVPPVPELAPREPQSSLAGDLPRPTSTVNSRTIN
jgi:hypothetical protein